MPSAVASGDVKLISRELARLGQNLAFLTSSRIRRTTSTGGNGPGSVLLRHVLRDCINTAGRGVAIARKRPRGQKRPLLPLRSSRPLNPARRSASKARAWLAGVHSRLPHALEHRTCDYRASGMPRDGGRTRVGRRAGPIRGGALGRRGLWVPGGWASPEISNRNTQLVHI